LFSLSNIKERKDRTINGYEKMSEEHRIQFIKLKHTMLLIQEFCEGHNIMTQEVIRQQESSHNISINILDQLVNIFQSQCEISQMLIEMDEFEIEILISTMEVLIESIQGPCPLNQLFLVNKDGFPNCLDKIIQSNFNPMLLSSTSSSSSSSSSSSLLIIKVKSIALQLLSSCLEGRDNLTIHSILAAELDPAGFDLFRQYANMLIIKSQSKFDKEYITLSAYQEIEEYTLQAFSNVKNIMLELRLISLFEEKENELLKDNKKNNAADMLDEVITTIEISWKDRIESVSFPIPRDVYYLTSKTREDFLLETDLSTAEKRMKNLIVKAPVFMAEMQQIYSLSSQSKIYLFIHHNIVNIKWSMYALVVLLNLNIIMASYGEGSTDGYPSIQAGFKHLDKDEYRTSLAISLVLALLNLMGYVVIVCFLAITEVPIIIRQSDDYVQACLDDDAMKEEDYRDFGAFTWWFVTLIFNVLFIVMHLSNYPGKENQGLYLFLIFGINLPWTLSCIRNYIVVPNSSQTRIFCVIYDVLITKPFFRNHVILMVCSINGFTQSSWFPLMLMDIMNNSKLLANVARSVTDNAVALALVFYLFVCTVAIYAQFGLEYFEDWFVYDGEADDEESVGCHSVVSCFVLIFYNGVPNGSLGDVLDNINNRNTLTEGQDNNTYLQRVIFDLSFFIWVGILLFNIITGLMVDGFGALREEDNNRQDILENTCFVCGYSRSQYDDIPNFRGPSFDVHKSIDHDFWTYVYYYVYLKRKHKTEYSGVESYVWSQINENNNLIWIPTRNSAALQNNNNKLMSSTSTLSKSSENNNTSVEDSSLIEQIAKDIQNMKQIISTLSNKKKD